MNDSARQSGAGAEVSPGGARGGVGLPGWELVCRGAERIGEVFRAASRILRPAPPRSILPASEAASPVVPLGAEPVPMRVVERRVETLDTATLELRPERGRDFPRHAAGQFAVVFADVSGVRAARACSITSPPQRLPGIEIAVPVRPGARVARHLAHPARVGETLWVSGPFGEFCYRPDREEEELILVAAGSAVAPCVAMVEAALAFRRVRRIVLLHVARYERDLLFRERLEGLARSDGRFRLVLSLTRASPAWEGERGRIDAAMIERHVPASGRRAATWLVCGPRMMCWDVLFALDDLGVSRERIRSEAFGSPIEPERELGESRVAEIPDRAAG
ncbi:MAG: hypothetical protein HY905_03725 [Deltaproteobacteria bacterium]|nr:hypothetical protein [Deltaproteobacteria bacterium]